MRNNEIMDIIKLRGLGSNDKINTRDHYISLFMDTFNTHSYNSLLGQLTLLLICRYYSENSEFIRNLDRTTVLFDDSEWRVYQWINKQIEQFVHFSEKSNLWFLKINNLIDDNQNISNIEVFDEINTLDKILSNFKSILSCNCEIIHGAGGDLELSINSEVKMI